MTLVGAPDADIWQEAIEEFRKRNNSRSGNVSDQNDSASRRICKWRNQHSSRQGYFKQWCSHGMPGRTNQAVFTWQEHCRKAGTLNYEDRKSRWKSGVQKEIRRELTGEEVHKNRDCVTGTWKPICKQRQRVSVSYDPSIVTALWQCRWMEEDRVKKTCIKEGKKRGGIHQPFRGTWVADFIPRIMTNQAVFTW